MNEIHKIIFWFYLLLWVGLVGIIIIKALCGGGGLG